MTKRTGVFALLSVTDDEESEEEPLDSSICSRGLFLGSTKAAVLTSDLFSAS